MLNSHHLRLHLCRHPFLTLLNVSYPHIRLFLLPPQSSTRANDQGRLDRNEVCEILQNTENSIPAPTIRVGGRYQLTCDYWFLYLCFVCHINALHSSTHTHPHPHTYTYIHRFVSWRKLLLRLVDGVFSWRSSFSALLTLRSNDGTFARHSTFVSPFCLFTSLFVTFSLA